MHETAAADGSRVKQLLLCRVLCGKHKDYGTGLKRDLVKPPPGCSSVKGGPHSIVREASDMRATWHRCTRSWW